VSYSTLKDKAIKALLSESKLPLSGDRAAWITRHKRYASVRAHTHQLTHHASWVMTWNANLDRAPAQQHAPARLRAALREWEDAQARLARAKAKAKSPPAAPARHFAQLVAQARPTRGGGGERELEGAAQETEVAA
jgi:E3 ubiquitin-protein ligase RAD18